VKARISKYLGSFLTILVYTVLVFASTAVASNSASSGASAAAGSKVKPASSSFNWSGYVATGQAFNHIQGTITVPTVTCTVPYAQSLFWVGLDGYTIAANQTVEQDGVGAKCSGGQHPKVTYFAWWEMFQTNQATSLQTIPGTVLTVKPGDRIKATVAYNSSDKSYVLQLNNETTKQLFATTQYCIGNACSRQSAEWVAERYMLATNTYTALAQWRTRASLFTANGAGANSDITMKPINHYNYLPVNMMSQQTYKNLDTTSPLSFDGTAFNVDWKAAN
jgi:hypothetical protein